SGPSGDLAADLGAFANGPLTLPWTGAASMGHLIEGFLALALGWSSVAAEVRAQERQATPAEQYKAILKETQDLQDANYKEFVAHATKGRQPPDEARMKLVGRPYGVKDE